MRTMDALIESLTLLNYSLIKPQVSLKQLKPPGRSKKRADRGIQGEERAVRRANKHKIHKLYNPVVAFAS